MPSLKDTKRRIVSVKNTQKITRAMKLVSSAKYARANRAILNGRPYADSFSKMIKQLYDPECSTPLLEQRPLRKGLLIIVSTDRGLCGGLNTNLFKKCRTFLEESKTEREVSFELGLWGKRAVMFGSKCSENILFSSEKVLEKPRYEFAASKAEQVCELFLGGKFDQISIAYSHFKNAMTQEPVVKQLLPIKVDSEDFTAVRPKGTNGNGSDILEPNRQLLLERALGKQVCSLIFEILLDGSASEHAARMTAMDSATNNAEEVIRSLTLQYNRARQAAITKELIEITSGAEAL